MTDFAPWLHELKSDAPDLKGLKDFAASKGAAWPYWSNDKADYEKVIADDGADDATKNARRNALAAYYTRWQQQQSASAGKAAGWLPGVNLGKIVLVIFGLVIAWLIYIFLTHPGFLQALAQIDQARGLITFFFVLATTGVIIVVALGIFWVDNADDAQKRFQSAKELLSIIIGVLGTILGFYFGTASSNRANAPAAPPAVSQPAAVTGQSAAPAAKPPAAPAPPATPAPAATKPGG